MADAAYKWPMRFVSKSNTNHDHLFLHSQRWDSFYLYLSIFLVNYSKTRDIQTRQDYIQMNKDCHYIFNVLKSTLPEDYSNLWLEDERNTLLQTRKGLKKNICFVFFSGRNTCSKTAQTKSHPTRIITHSTPKLYRISRWVFLRSFFVSQLWICIGLSFAVIFSVIVIYRQEQVITIMPFPLFSTWSV